MYPFTHIPLKSIQTDIQMPYLAYTLLQTYYIYLLNFSPEFLASPN